MYLVANREDIDNVLKVFSWDLFSDYSEMKEGNKPPFECRVVDVKPNAQTTPHNHHDTEMWIILSGEGLVRSDEDERFVNKGDIILFEPLESHTIINLSHEKGLRFITIYWEDMDSFHEIAREKKQKEITASKKEIVLSAFPTPNGDLHVGHLAGPYIAADVYKRFSLLSQKETYLISGTLCHDNYISVKGKSLDLDFYSTAQRFSEEIKNTLDMANFIPDVFVTTKNMRDYEAIVQETFTKLHLDGWINFIQTLSWSCRKCQKHLFEAELNGECPNCNSRVCGNQCESCGFIFEDEQILYPHCSCGEPAIKNMMTRPVFSLEKQRDFLRSYFNNLNLSPRLQSFCEEVINKRLPNIPLGYISEQGISIPIKEYEHLKIYSLFEIVPRYIMAAKKLAEERKLSLSDILYDKNNHLSVFFGFDNSFLRLFIFPAILNAYDSDIRLPDAFVSNEFYNLEGSKFSTSRGHVIWGTDLIDKYSSDYVRYYLCHTRPEIEQTNFSLNDFQFFIEKNITLGWQKWKDEFSNRYTVLYEAKKAEAGKWDKRCYDFYNHFTDLQHMILSNYQSEKFSLRRVTSLLQEFMELTRAFGKENERFLTFNNIDESLMRTYIAMELMATRNLILFTAPIMPGFAQEVWSIFNSDISIWDGNLTMLKEWVKEETRI